MDRNEALSLTLGQLVSQNDCFLVAVDKALLYHLSVSVNTSSLTLSHTLSNNTIHNYTYNSNNFTKNLSNILNNTLNIIANSVNKHTETRILRAPETCEDSPTPQPSHHWGWLGPMTVIIPSLIKP